MTEISTFVFFDIEATGLLSCDPPKITELAFIACSREHLLKAEAKKVPRVLPKLILPVNPMKVIQPEATRLTGLDNFLLEHIKNLDANAIDLIKCFFNQLIKPVCLVAHHGNGFDYPILTRHLKKLNCLFDEDLLCIDSLKVFQKIDENKTTAIDNLLSTDLKAIQCENEKTPSKGGSKFAVINRSPYEKPAAAKCLFDSTTTSNDRSVELPKSVIKKSPARISYQLTEIYKRLNGCNPEIAHTAEADTMHLLMCAIATKNEFVEVADSMAIKFNSIPN